MTISRKPPKLEKKLPTSSEVDEIINRGGSTARNIENTEPIKKNRRGILINLYPEVIEQIDRTLRNRKIRTTRQRWIEEAIQEKLDAEIRTIQ